MKKVITASKYLNMYKETKRALMKDLTYVSNAETFEELINHEYEEVHVDIIVKRDLKSNPNISFEDERDEIEERLINTLKRTTNEIKEEVAKNKSREDVAELIKSSEYNIIAIQGTWPQLTFILDEGDITRGELVEFVDEIGDLVNGRYSGTGRGGSWSAWNIFSKKYNIELQVGLSAKISEDGKYNLLKISIL